MLNPVSTGCWKVPWAQGTQLTGSSLSRDIVRVDSSEKLKLGGGEW